MADTYEFLDYTGLTEFADLIKAKLIENSVTATATDGATYTATVDGLSALTPGAVIVIKPSMTATSVTPTLNVNSLGAKQIRRKLSGGTLTRPQLLYANVVYKDLPLLLMYDGTYWVATQFTKPSATDLYGMVGVENGGTGHDFSDIPANAIIRNSGDNTQLWYTPTGNGALYATDNNGVVSFGTLPIAQGGTGATSGSDACENIGALPKSGGEVTGPLVLSCTTDASGLSDTKPALIIGGNSSQPHIAIDGNEIIAKSNATTPTTLYLGDDSPLSIVSITGYFRTNNNNFGTTLPATNIFSGRIFFKKVT